VAAPLARTELMVSCYFARQVGLVAVAT